MTILPMYTVIQRMLVIQSTDTFISLPLNVLN